MEDYSAETGKRVDLASSRLVASRVVAQRSIIELQTRHFAGVHACQAILKQWDLEEVAGSPSNKHALSGGRMCLFVYEPNPKL